MKLHFQEPTKKKANIVKSMEAHQAKMEEIEITRDHILKEIELEKSLQSILRKEEQD